jgi:hypothetical protein
MEAQDVLCNVFRPDPVKRISLAQLRRHPWLTGIASELHPGALMPLASSLHLGRVQGPMPVMLSPTHPLTSSTAPLRCQSAAQTRFLLLLLSVACADCAVCGACQDKALPGGSTDR